MPGLEPVCCNSVDSEAGSQVAGLLYTIVRPLLQTPPLLFLGGGIA